MYRTILIPTDFSIESLSLLKVALEQHSGESLDIVFAHGYKISDSISDLLFYSSSKIISGLQTPDFNEAIAVLQNKPGSRIRSVKTLLFTGRSKSAFNRFIKANNVDEVIIPVKQFMREDSRSFDLTPFLKATAAEKIYISWEARPLIPEKELIAALFTI